MGGPDSCRLFDRNRAPPAFISPACPQHKPLTQMPGRSCHFLDCFLIRKEVGEESLKSQQLVTVTREVELPSPWTQ